MRFQAQPVDRTPTNLDDSGAVAAGLGVYTTLIDPIPPRSSWFQIRVIAGAGGSAQLALGAAGFEVNKLHWAFGAGSNYDVGNLSFHLPAGERLSIMPTVNITVEAHIYFY